MKVSVRMFAAAREAAGFEQQVLELATGATVADAAQALRGMFRESGGLSLKLTAFAVNHRYARPEELLKDGDELAVLPPVSGG